MTRAETYNTEYTKLNHAYIQIYDSYKVLLQAEDVDPAVKEILESILIVFNPTLDQIKSEMTVKTRFKDGSQSQKPQSTENTETELKNGGKIFHPKFQ